MDEEQAKKLESRKKAIRARYDRMWKEFLDYYNGENTQKTKKKVAASRNDVTAPKKKGS